MVTIIKKLNTFFALCPILHKFNWIIKFSLPCGKIISKINSCDTVIVIEWKVIDVVKQNKNASNFVRHTNISIV